MVGSCKLPMVILFLSVMLSIAANAAATLPVSGGASYSSIRSPRKDVPQCCTCVWASSGLGGRS